MICVRKVVFSMADVHVMEMMIRPYVLCTDLYNSILLYIVIFIIHSKHLNYFDMFSCVVLVILPDYFSNSFPSKKCSHFARMQADDHPKFRSAFIFCSHVNMSQIYSYNMVRKIYILMK